MVCGLCAEILRHQGMTASEFRHRLGLAATAAEINHLIYQGVELSTDNAVTEELFTAAVAKLQQVADAGEPGGCGGRGVEELSETFPNGKT